MRSAALLLALVLSTVLPAQPPKPRVHVIATGGTISNLGESGRRSGEELVAAIPRIGEMARVTVEQFSNVPSGSITVDMWRQLAVRIRELQGGPDAPAGFVITHGTDTMEETAFFLSLTVGGCSPVIVTGAMRPANAVGADGPANLLNAVRVAIAPAARGRSTLVLMNDEIFSARDVTKSNTSRMNAFSAPDAGVLGLADPDTVVFHRAAPEVSSACRRSAFDIAAMGPGPFPRVDVIYVHIGADSVAVDAAVAAGARGLVLAGVGRGGSTQSQGRALQRARTQGVLVATSNRTGSGRVGMESGRSAVPGNPLGASIGSADLNPQKARIVVMLGLAAGLKPAEIAALMEAR